MEMRDNSGGNPGSAVAEMWPYRETERDFPDHPHHHGTVWLSQFTMPCDICQRVTRWRLYRQTYLCSEACFQVVKLCATLEGKELV